MGFRGKASQAGRVARSQSASKFGHVENVPHEFFSTKCCEICEAVFTARYSVR